MFAPEIQTADSYRKSAHQQERLAPYPTGDYWKCHGAANWSVDSELWEYFFNFMVDSLPWIVNSNFRWSRN